MPVANPSSWLISAAVGALIVWRIVSRMRRMVGRQKYSAVRVRLTLVIFPVLTALLFFTAQGHLESQLGLAAGILIGAGLGIYGKRLTKFEHTSAGKFYTPSAHLGIALSLLLIGRLAWRAAELYFTIQSSSEPPAHVTQSPLTMLIFGMLAAYYVSYAFGLLRWSRQSQPELMMNPGVSSTSPATDASTGEGQV